MTLVMDGVLRKPIATPMPALSVRRRPEVRSVTSAATADREYVVGMDGIRRPVRIAAAASALQAVGAAGPALPTPREVLANLAEPARVETPSLPWAAKPVVAWKRPAIAFGLVATALVASGLMAHSLATPRATTARAEAAKAPASRPTKPAPAAVPVPVPQKAGLQQLLNDFVAANGNNFGIVVKDMKSGETASINPDRQIESASLYKLFVAQRIYQQIDIGQLDYSQAAGGGTGRNIDQCLTVMINISDNACGRALGTILGWGDQDQALRLEGYKQTTLMTPQQTSAGDVATLFTRLYSGTLLSANSSQRFTDLLKSQRVNNRLPVGLPAGTVIAHKTGDLDGVVHDAGIVYGPKTDYLVVVTSGPWNSPGNAPAMFADLSSKLWNYFEQ